MDYGNFVGMGMGYGAVFAPFVLLLIVWNLFWKGLALWHSANRHQGWWFVIMLVVNTAGILEIIYLFAVLKLKAAELIPRHR